MTMMDTPESEDISTVLDALSGHLDHHDDTVREAAARLQRFSSGRTFQIRSASMGEMLHVINTTQPTYTTQRVVDFWLDHHPGGRIGALTHARSVADRLEQDYGSKDTP